MRGTGSVDFRPRPGCLVRTDYVEILRVVRDSPGILRSGIYAATSGNTHTTAKPKRVNELVEAGMLSEAWIHGACEYSLTAEGARLLAAIESIPGMMA